MVGRRAGGGGVRRKGEGAINADINAVFCVFDKYILTFTNILFLADTRCMTIDYIHSG